MVIRIRLAKRIFCQTKSAPAVAPNSRIEAKNSDTAMSRASGRIASGLIDTMFSNSRKCGFSTIQQTTQTAISFRKVLTNCIRPSGPKMRLNP